MSHHLHELARARGVADPVLPLYGPPDNGMLSFRLPAARRDAFKAWCRPGDA